MALGVGLGLGLAVGCSPAPNPSGPSSEPGQEQPLVPDLMVRGVAHAEIDEWPAAIASFEQALAIGGDDPVLVYNLAVCQLRSDQPEFAVATLQRIDDTAPAEVRARAHYLRGKLALEAGDLESELAAYRQAMALDPSEPAYPFALSQLVPRLGAAGEAEVGPLLERAAEIWPDNARLEADLIAWSLSQPDPDAWPGALDRLSRLTPGEAQAAALLERARAELVAEPERAPTSARRALNVLRPGKRFQSDWAALEARLALLPRRWPARPELLASPAAAVATPTLELADLLPDPALASDEGVLALVASIDAVDAASPALRATDLTLLTDRRLVALDRARDSFRPVGEVAGGRRLLIGDLDADGRMERIVLGDRGLAVFRRQAEEGWSQDPGPASPPLSDGILVDYELDGDLDLLLIEAQGEILLARNLGEGGLAAPTDAGLPVARGTRLLARDLDGDVDPELLVADGERITLLRNLRQEEYRWDGELSVEGAVEDWLVIDLDGDATLDLIVVVAGRLRIFRSRGLQGFEPDLEADATVASRLGEASAVLSIDAADLDLDGAPELVVEYRDVGEGRTVEVLAIDSWTSLVAVHGLDPKGEGLVTTDLDRDRDPDLVLLTPRGLKTLHSGGAEGQGWVELVLRGLASKVPLDGRGARVDVWFGLERRSFQPDLPEIVVGAGGRRPALVEVTWPNGITEFVFEPEVERTHEVKQELRVEGSCPFLYASDGRDLRFVTDVLSLAPLGMLADGERYVPADPEEYLRLPDWVVPDVDSGDLRLAITEELREVAYLDQAELVVVDAPAEVNVYNGERWIEGMVEGLDLRLLGPLQRPTRVRDAADRDVLDLVAERDHRYLRHSAPGRRYQGAGHARALEFAVPSELAATGRVALLMTGWLHWGNTSTNVARSQDPEGRPVFPYLELPNADGSWRRVELAVGLPAGKTKPIVVELGDRLDPEDPRFRITTDFEVYWDWIAVAEALPLGRSPHREQRLAPARAELGFAGFSRWYRPAPDGPYLFDRTDRRPYPWRPTESGERVLSWTEHQGFYSPYGEATAAITGLDDQLVVFGSGEELTLDFDLGALAPPPAGWERTYFLHLEGWEKDGDPNVACSQTVGPLPRRGAGAYSCEGVVSPNAEPSTATGRWVDGQRLHRRVRAALRSGLGPR